MIGTCIVHTGGIKPGVARAQTEVHVLEREEICLVEESDGREDFPPDQHDAAADRVDACVRAPNRAPTSAGRRRDDACVPCVREKEMPADDTWSGSSRDSRTGATMPRVAIAVHRVERDARLRQVRQSRRCSSAGQTARRSRAPPECRCCSRRRIRGSRSTRSARTFLSDCRRVTADPSPESLSTTRMSPGRANDDCSDRTASQVCSGVR